MLTAFFGVGGGFVIVPALVLGLSMTDAVGTSMPVRVINAVVALGVRLDRGGIEWPVVAPFAVSSIAGVLVGSPRRGGPVHRHTLPAHDHMTPQRSRIWCTS
jgi:uncharacterized membrane protein YfcA